MNYAKSVRPIAKRLASVYGNFNHYNLPDPTDELFFIICSVKTAESVYRRIFLQLKSRFPSWDDVLLASLEQIADSLRPGGLENQKAKHIKVLATAVAERFGHVSLDQLAFLSNSEAEQILLSLPGVGRKVARCVLLYSLGRKVFPVDTHVCRIVSRLGWSHPSRSDNVCSQDDQDRIQALIPPALRYSLHVNFVSHGRAICKPRNPLCGECPIEKYCPKVGVISVGTIS